VNQEQLTAIVRDGGGLVDLWEVSPIRLEDNAAHTEALIDALFPGNPLLCCGKNNSDFNTYSREEWRGKLAAQQLIVPSPMTARIGRTKKGKESAHALETTAARRFLVIEFDCGGVDEHAALLLYLASASPVGDCSSQRQQIITWLVLLRRPSRGAVATFYAICRLVRRRSYDMDALAVCTHARRAA